MRFVGVLCMVSTCLLGGHYPHGSALDAQDAFTGRLQIDHSSIQLLNGTLGAGQVSLTMEV
jgi:hypothetical protein